MKNLYTSIAIMSVAALMLGGFFAVSFAHAEDSQDSGGRQEDNSSVAMPEQGDMHSSSTMQSGSAGASEKQKSELEKEQEHATSSETEGNESDHEGSATSTKKNEHENENENDAEEHRSAVADFVQKLHDIASSTPGGIGDEVREVAREQNQTATATVEALNAVESRSAFLTFLIGADQRSLGDLQNSVNTMQGHIDRLNQINSETTGTVHTALGDEIAALAKEKARVQSIIDTNRSKNGIFGWFLRFFR